MDPDCTGVGSSVFDGAPILLLPNSPGTGSIRAIGCATGRVSPPATNLVYSFTVAEPTTASPSGLKINTENISDLSSITSLATIRYTTDTSQGRLCMHRVQLPNTPNPTCNGGNCGPGMIELDLDSDRVFYNGVQNISQGVRVCKEFFEPNPDPVVRNLRVLSPSAKRIFTTNDLFNGDLRASVSTSGVIGADFKCNNDSNRPTAGVPYLAMITDTSTPSRGVLTTNVGNPFLGNQLYTRNNTNIELFVPDAFGLPTGTLINSIRDTTGFAWTGLGNSFNISSNNCLNWMSSNNSQTGSVGNVGTSTLEWSFSTTNTCDTVNPLICVESRYRVWVTSIPLPGQLNFDAACNDFNDANHPRSGYYKAMVVFGNRIPGGIDWVFKPFSAYYRADRITLISIADSAGRLQTPLNASITATSLDYWTGSDENWNEDSANNCNNFTGLSGFQGAVGNSIATGVGWLRSGITNCNNSRRLLCVEQ